MNKRENKATGVIVAGSGDKIDQLYRILFIDPLSISLPVAITVSHKGFWITDNEQHVATIDKNCNRNSVMLTTNCLPYIYKIAFRHLLLSLQVIDPSDIDNANLVPHIKVRRDSKDSFSHYDSIQEAQFIINENDVSIKNDFITLELDRKKDLHTTLIYSKKIKQRVDLLKAFKFIIQLLNQYPELISRYASLENFGKNVISYWYECSKTNSQSQYPFNIELPLDYKPLQVEKPIFKITPGGSII